MSTIFSFLDILLIIIGNIYFILMILSRFIIFTLIALVFLLAILTKITIKILTIYLNLILDTIYEQFQSEY